MSISLEGVTKRYAGQVTVDAVTLEVEKGELFVLLGASGSGKSTILRLIAGLGGASRGSIDQANSEPLPASSVRRLTG